MKAWSVPAPGGPLQLVDAPEPQLRAGGALLDVLAVHVPAYTDVLVSGARGGFPTPLVLGCAGVARVRATGEDVLGVRAGDVVVVSGLLRSGRTAEPEEVLLAWTGIGGAGRATATTDRMRTTWRDGVLAERVVLPERVLTTLPGAGDHPHPEQLAFLPWLGIAAQAVARADVRAGQVVAVIGATGQLGGAAVLVALARGASAVVAVGRDQRSLARLAAVDARVAPVSLTGDRDVDGAAVTAAAGPVDAVIDALGAAPTPQATMAGYDVVRPDGTWVLVGGVRQDLPIPYGDFMHRRLTLRGSWMYEPTTVLDCWRMVAAGLVDLSALTVHTVGLDDPAGAVDLASRTRGLSIVVMTP